MRPSHRNGRTDSTTATGPGDGCAAAAITAATASAHNANPPSYRPLVCPPTVTHAKASPTAPTTAADSHARRATRDVTGPRWAMTTASTAPARIDAARVSVP